MVDMSCEEHDRQAASTQFITHTVGRVLGAMELQATPIDTRQAISCLPLTPLLYLGFWHHENSDYCFYHCHYHNAFDHTVLTSIIIIIVFVVNVMRVYCFYYRCIWHSSTWQHPQRGSTVYPMGCNASNNCCQCPCMAQWLACRLCVATSVSRCNWVWRHASPSNIAPRLAFWACSAFLLHTYVCCCVSICSICCCYEHLESVGQLESGVYSPLHDPSATLNP